MTEFELLQSQLTALTAKVDELLTLAANATVFSPPSSVEAPCSWRLFAWLDEWFETIERPTIEPSTAKGKEVYIRLHVKGNLPDKRLNEYTALEIAKALTAIETSSNRLNAYDVLNGAFRAAKEHRLITQNLMDDVKRPRHKKEQGEALTLKQQAHLMSITKGLRLNPLYRFYILTGARKGEAVNVLWSDIDYDAGTLRLPGTKTDLSDRPIPLFAPLKELLATIPRTDKRIFPVSVNTVSCSFNRLKERYDLPYSIKDLRHTFATRCLEVGIAPKTVQKWMGHTKIDMTMNVYTHVQTAFELSEAQKFNPKL